MKKSLPILLIVLVTSLMVVSNILPVHAQAGFVNTARTKFQNASTVTVTISNVLAGDVLLIGTITEKSNLPPLVQTVTDSISTTYKQCNNINFGVCFAGINRGEVEIHYGTALSTANSVTVTITFQSTATGGIAEVSQYEGFTFATNPNAGTASGSTSSISVTTMNGLQTGSITYGIVGIPCLGSTNCTPSPVPVYTSTSPPTTGTVQDQGTDIGGGLWHAFSALGDGTSSSFSGSTNNAYNWVAVIIELIATVSYSLSNSSPIFIQQTSTGVITVTVAWNFGPTTTITLSCSGLPAGVTCSFSGVATIGSLTPSVIVFLTINVQASVSLGQYSFTIVGSPSGSPSASTTVNISVTANLGLYSLALIIAIIGIGAVGVFFLTKDKKRGRWLK